MKSESHRVPSLMEGAVDEARRIEASDPDRARALCGVATQFVTLDVNRTWELLNEAVRAANSAEKFDGANTRIISQLWTREGPKIRSVKAEEFGFRVVLQALSKDEVERSIELAKGLKNEAPQAEAILAIAATVLEKRGATPEQQQIKSP